MSKRRAAIALLGALTLAVAGQVAAGDPHGYSVLSVDWAKEPLETLGDGAGGDRIHPVGRLVKGIKKFPVGSSPDIVTGRQKAIHRING